MMARAIYESYDEEAEIYCGIGGMHYSSKFTKMANQKWYPTTLQKR